jgi:flotillin
MAKLEAQAKSVENEAAIASETERMMAEQELQSLRREVETLRLQCEVVLPAEAQRKSSELRARGDASPTIENGKATAEALRLIAQEWASAGTAGKEVYVLQQLRTLVRAAATRVSETEIGDLQVVTGAEDNALGAVIASYPNAIQKVLQEMGGALGVDLRGLLGKSERRPQ